MTDRQWRFKNAWKCGKCPQSHDENGCPAWWEYPNAQGKIVKGCAFHQDILLNMLLCSIHEAHCAAASADKATNHAVEGMIAAQGAMKAASTSAALMIGSLTGEIEHKRCIDGRSNGDVKSLPNRGSNEDR